MHSRVLIFFMTKKITPNFIGEYQIPDKNLCEEIIQFFEKNTDLHKIGAFGNYEVDNKKKDSIELTITPKQLNDEKYKIFNTYFTFLKECFSKYLEDWPFLKHIKSLGIGPFHIQKYNINGHYNSWHTERDSIMNSERILVFMTYLNNIDEGGETEFLHYNVKIKPKKSNTIIWPSEWTHAHRGLPTTKKEKYIITGWIKLF